MIGNTIFPYKSEIDNNKMWEDIQNIYAHIIDEDSKRIFAYRLLLSLTGDEKYIRKLILCTEIGIRFETFLKKQKDIYIYGAGIRGRRLVQMFPEMNWSKYIDKKITESCNGLDVIPPEQIVMQKDSIILITNYEGYEEIKSSLIAQGIESRKIICMSDFEKEVQKNQYFESRCIERFKNTPGHFVDAGCFDGRDCIRFLESSLYANNEIYAFEPDNTNYRKCTEMLSEYKNVEISNVGLADIKGKTFFMSEKGEKARVTNEGNSYICIDTLDDVLCDKKIGFVKMDIEGSEKKALIGAKQHIISDKPNMMISIYHKMEDIIEIPHLLLEYTPQYYFAFGHYSIGSAADTVLYAFEK